MSEDLTKTEENANAQASQEAARLGRAYHNKANVNIIVDSCADFAPEVVEALGVEVVSFSFVMGGQEHADDFWKSMSPHDFYERMRAGEVATTAAVTPGHYLEVFERAAQKGTPTIYLAFTRGLSSSVDAARQAADMIHEKYPDFELYVVDNLCPSAAATVGGKLDIKPELSYDLNGALTLRGMCRGRKKALRAILADFKASHLSEEDLGGTPLPIGVVSADAEKDAKWLVDQLRKEPGCADVPVIYSSVSPVIGAHVGPGMVALAFWGKDRRESLSFTDRIARRVRGKRDESAN